MIATATRHGGGYMLQRLIDVGEGVDLPAEGDSAALRAALASVSVEVPVAISSRALALVCAGVSV